MLFRIGEKPFGKRKSPKCATVVVVVGGGGEGDYGGRQHRAQAKRLLKIKVL